MISRAETTSASPSVHPDSVRIAVLLAQLRGAGIQRMRFNIIRCLLRRGYQVDLVVGAAKGELVDEVPPGVSLYTLSSKGRLGLPVGLMRYLRERQPSHVMSSYEDLSIMLLLAKKVLRADTFTLLSTHNAISQLVHEGGRLNRLKQRLLRPMMKSLYPSADSLVAVSEGVALELHQYLNLPLSAINVIYNPVIADSFAAQLAAGESDLHYEQDGAPTIGFFGRLHEQKRVDLLIDAFAMLRQKAACRLLLVGEGAERERLELRVAGLGLGGDVHFFGFSESPYALMRRCHVVALPSDYEGLGNVLVEAMACGTQVVSTDCPHGPREILQDGKYGQLVEVGDAEGLCTALMNSINNVFRVDPELLVQRAMEFSADTATDSYLRAMKLPVAIEK